MRRVENGPGWTDRQRERERVSSRADFSTGCTSGTNFHSLVKPAHDLDTPFIWYSMVLMNDLNLHILVLHWRKDWQWQCPIHIKCFTFFILIFVCIELFVLKILYILYIFGHSHTAHCVCFCKRELIYVIGWVWLFFSFWCHFIPLSCVTLI